MIKASRVLLLPNWDIVDVINFYSITNKLSIAEKGKKEIKGAKFN